MYSTALATPFANCTDGEVRLVGSVDGDEGRLEVCVNSAWGTVCSEGFGASDAAVACQSLGGYSGMGENCVCCVTHIVIDVEHFSICYLGSAFC